MPVMTEQTEQNKQTTDTDMSDRRVEAALAEPEVVDAYEFFVGAGMVTRSGSVNPVSIYAVDPLAGS